MGKRYNDYDNYQYQRGRDRYSENQRRKDSFPNRPLTRKELDNIADTVNGAIDIFKLIFKR